VEGLDKIRPVVKDFVLIQGAARLHRLLFYIRPGKGETMKLVFRLLVVLFFVGCKVKNTCPGISVDNGMLDSVKKKMDTSYSKPYRSQEFATTEYYINKKDTTVCQLMRDTANQIRQVLIAKKEKRIFTAEYYSNGQLKASWSLDNEGRLNGAATLYFETGCIKSKGVFHNGLYYGVWENYDQNGTFLSTDQYDSNGQLVKTVKRK
jgi:antitoxin component YwqK of YwqJK toxin-antitoxin module